LRGSCPIYISGLLIHFYGRGNKKGVKIVEFVAYGAGAIIGVLLGVAGFLKFYLPLKAGLGLDIAASQDLSGVGSIVPMENLVPLYTMAGTIIDLIVLLAFIIAGMYGIFGIIQALRKKS
jgi:hypothetical protein